MFAPETQKLEHETGLKMVASVRCLELSDQSRQAAQLRPASGAAAAVQQRQ